MLLISDTCFWGIQSVALCMADVDERFVSLIATFIYWEVGLVSWSQNEYGSGSYYNILFLRIHSLPRFVHEKMMNNAHGMPININPI